MPSLAISAAASLLGITLSEVEVLSSVEDSARQRSEPAVLSRFAMPSVLSATNCVPVSSISRLWCPAAPIQALTSDSRPVEIKEPFAP
ncbi:unannotated protein [freshwater metagenome]|uniref:Unannotated protein n=1 Tax=freshwater metagenome TaxID=449393 RepID=A0A6J6JDD7_9ZZZZ